MMAEADSRPCRHENPVVATSGTGAAGTILSALTPAAAASLRRRLGAIRCRWSCVEEALQPPQVLERFRSGGLLVEVDNLPSA